MVRAGQSAEKAALIYQHSDDEDTGDPDDQRSGTNLARDH
jgi:hypothetical protein